MSKYSQGKIYIIRSDETDEVYIGSTYRTLIERLIGHKSHYDKFLNNTNFYISSFEILKYDSCRIELLEEVSVETKQELLRREGEFIRQFSDTCVNLIIAGRTPKERYEDNKDKNLEYQKEYYEANKDKISEYQQEYYEANKDKIAKHREANKKVISERRKTTIECPNCHEIVIKDSLARHRRSEKCQLNTKAILVFDSDSDDEKAILMMNNKLNKN